MRTARVGRNEYYQSLKSLAREKRQAFGIRTDTLGLREVRKIYRAEDVTIDLWPHKLRKVRAAYFPNDGAPCVLLNKNMPVEPRLFSLLHELKHHFVDGAELAKTGITCRDYANGEVAPEIEIGAEVFAAEFIFPEEEFAAWASQYVKLGQCRPEDVVALKRNCSAKVSYTYLVKRLEWLHFAEKGTLGGVNYTKLEERLYGPPLYKKILAWRQRRTAPQGS
jgi:Zn-dependent peptidase ImmA (M78 family)